MARTHRHTHAHTLRWVRRELRAMGKVRKRVCCMYVKGGIVREMSGEEGAPIKRKTVMG